ncbi:DUF5916 domain-containing protein [Gemmatimonas sp.]|uniref:carbohydrate binding family 9 domain-containing protein n=1 Tax=Gemmatimonas sp. TaxID=1962908 RepID=UPI0039835186
MTVRSHTLAATATLVIAAALSLSAPRAAAQSDARAFRTSNHITLDGRFSEPDWARADSITDFRQRDPEEGAPASERTVVRLLATPDGLAVGWWCADREPKQIVRSQLRRDASLNADDHVAVVVDGLHDKRSGFYFRANANGAMSDAEHLTFESSNEDWDGVWNVRSEVTATGYQVEMLIPWATLRYAQRDSVFGMNFRRFMPRKNEEVLFRGWKRSEGFRFLEREALIGGFTRLPARPKVELRPYALAESRLTERRYFTQAGDSVLSPGGSNGHVGFDLKAPITSTLTADVTVNPDFAQAEVDRQIVNLTRFPLFFPEQRPFFTEGAGIFDFGRVRQTQMFYSRRIGLGGNGTPVTIPFGVRVQGRTLGNQVGLLAMRTGDAEQASNAVLRVKHDILGRGFLGAMATLSDRPARRQSMAGGLDFNLPYVVQGGQNLVVLGNASWSQDSVGAPVGGHYRVMVDYPNDNADIVVRFDRVDAGYNPALGFVQQRGVHRLGGGTSFTPRPRKRDVIRRFEFDLLSYDVVWDLNWRLNNASLEVKPLGVQFQTGDQIELNVQRQFDAPTDDFTLFPGATVRARGYWWNRVEAQYSGAERRTVRFNVTGSTGQFYDGRSSEVSAGVRLRRTPHVLATVDVVRSVVSLAQTSFTANTVRLRSDYAFSPRLNSTLFAQWDNQSNRASANARVRWTVKPGSDLFVVWNSNWPTGLNRPIPWSRPSRGGLVAKYVYFFRS